MNMWGRATALAVGLVGFAIGAHAGPIEDARLAIASCDSFAWANAADAYGKANPGKVKYLDPARTLRKMPASFPEFPQPCQRAEARTFVLPHALEKSGRITNTNYTFDNTIFSNYSGGIGNVRGPGEDNVDIYLFAGGSIGGSNARTERSCTRAFSLGVADDCTPGAIGATNSSTVGGVVVGIGGPRIGPFRPHVELEALFPTGTVTSGGTPVTNLGPGPENDTYSIRDRSIVILSGTAAFPIPGLPNVSGVAQFGGAWIDKDVTYNCTATGFCGTGGPGTPFSQTQSVSLTGTVFGGGVETVLPPIANGMPPVNLRLMYTRISTGSRTISFGSDVNRSVQYNVAQDFDLFRAQLTVPIFSIPAAGSDAGVFSDIRLKHEIARVGELDSGLPLYRYKYLWSDQVYVGVMAHEVAEIFPEAVQHGEDGYLRVNYSRLGTRMMTWEQWSAERS